MSAVIIDGFSIAAAVRAKAAQKAAELVKKGITPCLAVILVGEDPASISYVTGKTKALAEAGMIDRSFHLHSQTGEAELLDLIARLNADTAVHGILVQLPLPAHINSRKVIEAILPEKDVDGFHPVNAGNMLIGNKCFLPCTPHGVLVLLREMNIQTSGAHAVIVGRSNLVGRPLSVLLSGKEYNATVTLCHTGTRDLAFFTAQADILVAAAGKPGCIHAGMIKKGACVIDVGVNRVPDAGKKSGFRLTGDVDFEGALDVASAITPVPKGVGPMTIAMLIQNVLEAANNSLIRKGSAL